MISQTTVFRTGMMNDFTWYSHQTNHEDCIEIPNKRLARNNMYLCDTSRKKGPFGNGEKYQLWSGSRSLIMVKNFRSWEIFCVLCDNST